MKIFLDANICLDLLDTKRLNSKESVTWYLENKDNEDYEFYLSSDFITTFFYILTQKRKYNAKDTLMAIDTILQEIKPIYINNFDYIEAKNEFFDEVIDDFEDLLVLNSAVRLGCKVFITRDKKLLDIKKYKSMKITNTYN